jgi:hypothetical protein
LLRNVFWAIGSGSNDSSKIACFGAVLFYGLARREARLGKALA